MNKSMLIPIFIICLLNTWKSQADCDYYLDFEKSDIKILESETIFYWCGPQNAPGTVINGMEIKIHNYTSNALNSIKIKINIINPKGKNIYSKYYQLKLTNQGNPKSDFNYKIYFDTDVKDRWPFTGSNHDVNFDVVEIDVNKNLTLHHLSNILKKMSQSNDCTYEHLNPVFMSMKQFDSDGITDYYREAVEIMKPYEKQYAIKEKINSYGEDFKKFVYSLDPLKKYFYKNCQIPLKLVEEIENTEEIFYEEDIINYSQEINRAVRCMGYNTTILNAEDIEENGVKLIKALIIEHYNSNKYSLYIRKVDDGFKLTKISTKYLSPIIKNKIGSNNIAQTNSDDLSKISKKEDEKNQVDKSKKEKSQLAVFLIVLKAYDGNYLGISKTNSVVFWDKKHGEGNRFELISQGDKTFAIKASNGKYVSFSGGDLKADKNEVGPNEKYIIEKQSDGKYSIKTIGGKYVRAAKTFLTNSLSPDRDIVGDQEKYEFLEFKK